MALLQNVDELLLTGGRAELVGILTSDDAGDFFPGNTGSKFINIVFRM
jgi:hypothetical protein